MFRCTIPNCGHHRNRIQRSAITREVWEWRAAADQAVFIQFKANQDQLKKYGYRPILIVGWVDEIEFPLKW